MYYAQFPVSSGQLASGPWFPAAQLHPLAQLAVDGQVLSARCSGQVLPELDHIEPAAMRSKEALAALTVLGATALATRHPGLMEPGQEGMHAQCGLAPAFCFGSSTSTAGSPASTPTPLHALQCLRQSSCFLSDAVDGVVPQGSWGAVGRGIFLQPGDGVGTGLDDSTSPLSACSRLTIAGAPTPCGSEALSGTQAGCKRTYNQAFQQQQQLQYQQQQVQYHPQVPLQQAIHIQQQQQGHTAHMLLQKQAQHTKQLQQQQMQATLGVQPAVLQKQQTQQQLQTYFNMRPGPVVGRLLQQQNDQYLPVQLQQHMVPAGQLLVSQSSATSSTSDGTSRQQPTAAPNLAMLLQQQQSQQYQQQQGVSTVLTSVGASHQQQQQQCVLLRPAAVTSDTLFMTQANNHSSSWAACLQRLREQQLQPPSKRAATAAAYAALVTAANKQQQQQRSAQALLRSGSVSSCQLPQAPAAGPYDSSKLLGWAGQVLNCQLIDAYRMAQHIYSRASAQLDDMLLITLGVTQPMDKVTMLVSLWMATKLEGHRRQVVGCSKLATALQMVPWAVTSVELHIMQALSWRPYAGYGGQGSCVVSEL